MLRFSDNYLPVLMRTDAADPSGPPIEIEHETRDYREGDRVVTYRVRLGWTVPPAAGDAGGSCARERIAGWPSSSCRAA
jgi:hypothetical protein